MNASRERLIRVAETNGDIEAIDSAIRDAIKCLNSRDGKLEMNQDINGWRCAF